MPDLAQDLNVRAPNRLAWRRVSVLTILLRFVLPLAASLHAVDLSAGETLVVLTPHVVTIRYEFGRAFSQWHQQKFGQHAEVEWRDVGGTSDAVKFVQSEFAQKPQGIGLDIFFGGGSEPFLLFAEKGLTEPCPLPAEVIAGIPPSVNGVELYDRNGTWYGAALSSFGILQNTALQQRLGLPQVRRWEDLANPRLRGWVGAGDPRNSGTMNNMFEAILQAYGWKPGWRLLTQIAGNVNRFDRLSSTTAKEVTLGETIYAFCIDFYGFNQVAAAGRTNMSFVLPEDFTAISPDGIAILKGAPHLLQARRFLEFCLGEEGQKLWFLPRGHAEGPQKFSIERMSVRPDFYRRFRHISNIAYSPFELKQSFVYNTKLARARREVVASLAGSLLVDTHPEMRRAWKHLIQMGANEGLLQELGEMPISEAEAGELAAGAWKDPSIRNQKRMEWQSWAQKKYRRLASAKPGDPNSNP